MSNKRKLRVPGRYERPAGHRAPLGDHASETAIRRQYAIANRGRVRNNQLVDELLAEGGLVETTPQEWADPDPGCIVPDPSRFATDLDHLLVAGAGEVALEAAFAELDRPLAILKSAGTTMLDRPAELEVRESVSVALAEQPGDGPTGRLAAAVVIRSGWNSSGSRYYPAGVLERDVPQVYGKGTQVYIDHPRLSEQDDIPERSLTTLAGVFEDDPWPVREADGTVTMRTNVRVFAPWQPLIREAWKSIGLSINGGGRGEFGERDGREGTIIEALTYGRSVDFVTVPGAGGRVLALLESHQPFAPDRMRAVLDRIATREAGSLGAFVESRIHLGFTELGDQLYGSGRVTRDERITLSGAIGDALDAFVRRLEADAPQLYQRSRYDGPDDAGQGEVPTEEAERRLREATAAQAHAALERAVAAAYGGDRCWTTVHDYDPDRGLVWFYVAGEEGPGTTWQQSYITSEGTAVLTGGRLEVCARTVYEPVNTPGPVPGVLPAADRLFDDGEYREADSKTTAGGAPAADNGPNAPATLKESDMGEKTADVVAREAAEARATAAELELARYRAGDIAAPIITSLLAESGLPQPARDRISAEYAPVGLPLREADRSLDEGVLRTAVAASIKAEQAYVDSLREAAGAGAVRGAGPGAGAGAGAPGGFFAPQATTESAAGGFFGFGGTPVVPQRSEAEIREAGQIRERMIAIYMGRGATREAAVAAVDADI